MHASVQATMPMLPFWATSALIGWKRRSAAPRYQCDRGLRSQPGGEGAVATARVGILQAPVPVRSSNREGIREKVFAEDDFSTQHVGVVGIEDT
jgi:hypothetical protein